MKVRLYVEGGGDSRWLHRECCRGFSKLFEKAGFKERMPAITACGSRSSAYQDFETALENVSRDSYPILLVDSEAAVRWPVWKHLQERDGWPMPDGARDDQGQLMVQCMETWCVADREALRRFFGQHLQNSALPALQNMEERAKADVQQALEQATRECGRDRKYKKGKRSFRLIAELDPDVLKNHLPHFVEICNVLDKRLDVN